MGWIVSSAVNGILGDDGGEKYSGGGGLFIDGIPSEGNELFTGGRSSVVEGLSIGEMSSGDGGLLIDWKSSGSGGLFINGRSSGEGGLFIDWKFSGSGPFSDAKFSSSSGESKGFPSLSELPNLSLGCWKSRQILCHWFKRHHFKVAQNSLQHFGGSL